MLAAIREHQVKPGQVLNKEGKNGHRARQELIAAILDEPEDCKAAPEPGKSRIRNVVLSLARETYAGGPGSGGAGKTLAEFYAGKARQQIAVSGNVSNSRTLFYLPSSGRPCEVQRPDGDTEEGGE
jgi:hypothetical protein